MASGGGYGQPPPALPVAPPSWDIRLVPAAGLSWLTAWSAPLLPVAVLVSVAASALVLASACLWAGRPLRNVTARRWMTSVALTLGGVVLVAAPAAAHVYARDQSPLRALAVQGQRVQVDLEVNGSVGALRPGTSGSRALVHATVLQVRCDHRCAGTSVPAWRLHAQILVFAPAPGWAQLASGSMVTADLALAVASPGDLLVAVAFARAPPLASAPPSGALDAAAASIRGSLRERADSVLGRDAAGLLRGVVVGDTSGMDANLIEDFRVSGLSHLTAVSGTNCAIVVAAVLWPLRRSRLRAAGRAVFAGLALAGFVVLVGPQPSVLRAAVMAAISLLALARGRARQAVPALATAVLILLAVNPGLARDVGFALSVAATAGIILVAAPWTLRLRARGWPGPLAVAVSVSAAAGLFTAPLLVLIMPRVSLVSLPANVLVVPVVAAITVIGLTAALLAPVSAWPSEVLIASIDWPLRWMVLVAERAAGTPGATLPWWGGIAGALSLVLTFIGAIWLLRHRRIRWLIAAACVGIAVSTVSVRVLAPGWPPTDWSVVACDVGQGDAVVVSLGEGRALVVDTGPDPVLVDACLRRLGVDDVPLVVLSHLHADHIDGLTGVLHSRSVGAVATSLDPPPASARDRVREITEAAGVAMVALEVGAIRAIGPATIEVLGPVARYVGTRSDPNNSSLVARISLGGMSVLATGDVEPEAQRDLLRRRTDLSADVLKVPHHGSAYQELDFLAASGARVGLVSVGAGNDYGHPDEELLDRLRASGMSVHRTDREGDLALVGVGVGVGETLSVLGRGDPIRARNVAADAMPVGDLSRTCVLRRHRPEAPCGVGVRSRWHYAGHGRRFLRGAPPCPRRRRVPPGPRVRGGRGRSAFGGPVGRCSGDSGGRF